MITAAEAHQLANPPEEDMFAKTIEILVDLYYNV